MVNRLLFLIFITTTSCAKTIDKKAKLENAHGFGDILLDAPESSFKNLVPYHSNPEVTGYLDYGGTYVRPNDTIYVNGYKKPEIQYYFLDGKLFGFFMAFYSEKKFNEMVHQLSEQYGKPQKLIYQDLPNKDEFYGWNANTFSVQIIKYYHKDYQMHYRIIRFLKNDITKTCEPILKKLEIESDSITREYNKLLTKSKLQEKN